MDMPPVLPELLAPLLREKLPLRHDVLDSVVRNIDHFPAAMVLQAVQDEADRPCVACLPGLEPAAELLVPGHTA